MNTNVCLGEGVTDGEKHECTCTSARGDARGQRKEWRVEWILIQAVDKEFHLLWFSRMKLMLADNNLPDLIENAVFLPNTRGEWKRKALAEKKRKKKFNPAK